MGIESSLCICELWTLIKVFVNKTVCGVTVSVKPFNSSSHSGASVGVLFLVDVGDQQGREFLLKHYLTCVNQDLGL